MNISQEAIDHLLETAISDTGWLSNMRVLRTLPETGEVEIVTGETIDVGQVVEEVLLITLPHIRAQIAFESIDTDQLARVIHAWDVKDGPCEGPFDNLTDTQKDVWRSAAHTVKNWLTGKGQQ